VVGGHPGLSSLRRGTLLRLTLEPKDNRVEWVKVQRSTTAVLASCCKMSLHNKLN